MTAFLVFAMRDSIRRISFDVPYYADVIVPLDGLKNAVALDVDTVTGNNEINKHSNSNHRRII